MSLNTSSQTLCNTFAELRSLAGCSMGPALPEVFSEAAAISMNRRLHI